MIKEHDLGGPVLRITRALRNYVGAWKTESSSGNDLCMQEFYSVFSKILVILYMCSTRSMYLDEIQERESSLTKLKYESFVFINNTSFKYGCYDSSDYLARRGFNKI